MSNDTLEAEVKTLSKNLESYKRESDKCQEDMQIHLNDVSEQLYTIQNNHLAHLKTDVEVLKANDTSIEKRITTQSKVIGWGLGLLALIIGVPTILAFFWQVFK